MRWRRAAGGRNQGYERRGAAERFPYAFIRGIGSTSAGSSVQGRPPPPEIPFDTDPEAAARARALADWLTSDEYLSGHPNVFTFDLFDLLADPTTNTLRPGYQTDEHDAHPNELANRAVGPLFVSFIDRAVETYVAISPTPATSSSAAKATSLLVSTARSILPT